MSPGGGEREKKMPLYECKFYVCRTYTMKKVWHQVYEHTKP